MKSLRLSILSAALVVAIVNGAGLDILTTEDSWIWQVVREGEVTLPVIWPDGADSARIDITDLNGTTTTENLTPPTAEYMWSVFDGAQPSEEMLYKLELTFLSGESEISTLSTQLAVVQPAFAASQQLRLDTSAAEWQQVERCAIIPYSAEWEREMRGATGVSLAVESQKNNDLFAMPQLTGYYGLILDAATWGYGEFDLALGFADSDAVLSATLQRYAAGSLIIVR